MQAYYYIPSLRSLSASLTGKYTLEMDTAYGGKLLPCNFYID